MYAAPLQNSVTNEVTECVTGDSTVVFATEYCPDDKNGF